MMKRRLMLLSALCAFSCASSALMAQQKPAQKSGRKVRVIDLGLSDEPLSPPAEPEVAPAPRTTPTTPAASSASMSFVALPWTGAYDPAPQELIREVRTSGLTSKALTVLDDVETPNAVRIMILDAASAEGGARRAADKLLGIWSGGVKVSKRLTVDRLSESQLLMIGYLAARASPDELAPLGGDTEIEKLTPMMLLIAATSRRRGDLTSRVVLALIKSQQSLIAPEETLCTPYACMMTAVQPFSQEWSVHPDVICAFALAGGESQKGLHADDPLKFCTQERSTRRPVFVEQARQEDLERRAASSAPAGGATPGQAPSSGGSAIQQELAMVELFLGQLKQERLRMTGMEAAMIDQMILELERHHKLISSQLTGTSAGATSPTTTLPADPFGIGTHLTF